MGHLTIRLENADAVHDYFFGLGDKEHIYDIMVSQIAKGIEEKVEFVRIAEVELDNGDDFIIDCWEEDWKENLTMAKQWYIDNEIYESCTQVQNLISQLPF